MWCHDLICDVITHMRYHCIVWHILLWKDKPDNGKDTVGLLTSGLFLIILSFMAVTCDACCVIRFRWQHCHSQWCHYGGCWWPGTYVAPGHLHPTWWCKPVCTLFFSLTVHVHYSWFRKMTSGKIFNQSRCTLSVAADDSVANAIRSNKLQHTCAYVVVFSVWYNSSRIIMAECFSFSTCKSEPRH